jgi:hypothetical protein
VAQLQGVAVTPSRGAIVVFLALMLIHAISLLSILSPVNEEVGNALVVFPNPLFYFIVGSDLSSMPRIVAFSAVATVLNACISVFWDRFRLRIGFLWSIVTLAVSLPLLGAVSMYAYLVT